MLDKSKQTGTSKRNGFQFFVRPIYSNDSPQLLIDITRLYRIGVTPGGVSYILRVSIEHERGKSVPFSDNSNNREEQFWARISVFLSKKKKRTTTTGNT